VEEQADLLALLETLALKAGREIMRHYTEGFAVENKADASPVTAADRDAEAIILGELCAQVPDLPCVAEENASLGIIPECGDAFLLVDPLDGTREFINRRPDFTVNIALIRHGAPVLGVVYAPARDLLFSGGSKGAFELELRDGEIVGRTEIRVRPRVSSAPVILASLSHRTPETDAYIARFPGSQVCSIGSSLKFCLLARGEADLYPRFGPTMQWDTAAGDAILRAAGGMTRDMDGVPLVYGARGEDGFSNPFFIAEGASITR
jgi:3'(2'), 5'-bisphosphate nucleotidase